MVPVRAYIFAGKLTAVGVFLGILVIMYVEPQLGIGVE
jgi:hypothetical protein